MLLISADINNINVISEVKTSYQQHNTICVIYITFFSCCHYTACCSGQVVKSVEAQTNKQEDKKDVPGKKSHQRQR